MKVELSDEAKRQARDENAWWRKNRDHHMHHAIDAFVIRSLLVPAIMELLGKRAWWLPDWLERILPRLHVEAGPDRKRAVPEPATATADD